MRAEGDRTRAGEKAILAANVSLFAFALLSFFFLPETIVHHWGYDGPDRIGGRYHVFYLPLFSGVISFLSLSFAGWYEKKDPADGETVRYVAILSCLFIAVVCMVGVLIILAYNVREPLIG